MMTYEQTQTVELHFGEYWVKTDKTNDQGEVFYELWGTTRVFDGKNFVSIAQLEEE